MNISSAQPRHLEVQTLAYEEFVNRIERGEPFTLTRWGNGEWHSVFGRTKGRKTGGQRYVLELGERLRNVLRSRPRYMMELKRWEQIFADDVERWLVNENLVDLHWIEPDILHKASMKGRLEKFVQALHNAPAFAVVGPDHLVRARPTLGFREFIEVPGVDAFDSVESICERTRLVASTMPAGGVITFSAGMTANILVDDLYSTFGEKLFLIDVGSLWDPYAGVLSRSYMQAPERSTQFLCSSPIAQEPDPAPLKPSMSEEEARLLVSAASGKKCAVEFGVGGSTFALLDTGVEHLVSIESDPEWVSKLATHQFILPHLASGRLQLHHADVGPTRKWGRPDDPSTSPRWPNYWNDAWQMVDPKDIDLVFVDGRFRVACALSSLLNCGPDVTIVIHDFWNRPKYAILQEYLVCAARAGTLGVFFSKHTIDYQAVSRDLARYSKTSA